VHESIHYAVKVLEGGAHGYVVKSGAVKELVEAIHTVSVGDVYVSPKVSQKVLQQLRRPKKDHSGLDALSPREFDLLRVLGAGMSLGQAAEHLKISTDRGPQENTGTWRPRVNVTQSSPSMFPYAADRLSGNVRFSCSTIPTLRRTDSRVR
jgi:FixJ family two-component response regulator